MLPTPCAQLLAVLVRVHFRRMLVMLGGMQMMPKSHLGMMRRLFVIAGLVVLGGLTMMLSRMLVVIRGLLMVFVDVATVHRLLPGLLRGEAGALPGIDEVFATRVCQVIAKQRSRGGPAATNSKLGQFLSQ